MKASVIKTKTVTSPTEDGLDGNIKAFCQTLNEQQFVQIRFVAAPGFFAALIVYTD